MPRMWLKRLEADRVRNLRAVQLELPAGLTVVAGRNGQGKTTLLEAVYLLSTGRSFRTRKAEEAISWEGGPLRVSGAIESRVGRSKLTAVLDGTERGLLVDGHTLELESYLGRLDVVDLTGERMNVLRGAPVERRRFLDRGVVGLDPSFLRALGEYRRVLQQRNALLRGDGGRGAHATDAQLDAWDERLVAAAAEVHLRRREYAVQLAGHLGPIERALFPSGESVVVHYRPSPSGAEEEDPSRFREVFAASLKRNRRRDRTLGHTVSGPHRDELRVSLDEIDLRKYGSAGQVRAAMIALKVAKLDRIRADRGEAPLFLMDDFDTDIDEVRAAALAGFLNEGGFQAIVATSKEAMAERLGIPFRLVRMRGGRAEVDERPAPAAGAEEGSTDDDDA